MKSTMKRISVWLALMAVAILTFTFTACSDDEDIENEVTYTYVFTEISVSHPAFLEEKGKIEYASSLPSVLPEATSRSGVQWKSATSRFTQPARKPAIRSRTKCGRAITS